MSAKIRDYYAEEVEFLTRCGESTHAIAQQLNRTPAALSRALYREGRPDLARPFETIVARARRHPCLDCPTEVRHHVLRCHPCSVKHRESDPEYRAAFMAGIERRNATPEFRAHLARLAEARRAS